MRQTCKELSKSASPLRVCIVCWLACSLLPCFTLCVTPNFKHLSFSFSLSLYLFLPFSFFCLRLCVFVCAYLFGVLKNVIMSFSENKLKFTNLCCLLNTIISIWRHLAIFIRYNTQYSRVECMFDKLRPKNKINLVQLKVWVEGSLLVSTCHSPSFRFNSPPFAAAAAAATHIFLFFHFASHRLISSNSHTSVVLRL